MNFLSPSEQLQIIKENLKDHSTLCLITCAILSLIIKYNFTKKELFNEYAILVTVAIWILVISISDYY